MAALPENYVSLQLLRERWLKRQQDEKGREGDVREGRRQESLSRKGRGREREREVHRAGDIADRRRSYYWSQNKDGGGGEGRPRGSESKIGSCAAVEEGGRELPREKEILESSCFASVVVGDSNGKGLKRGEGWPESSDQRRSGLVELGSGSVRAKEGGAGGNWPHPIGRNNAGGKGDGGHRREPAAPAVETGALEQPGPRRLDSEVRLGDQKSTIIPVDGSSGAVVEESGGKQGKSEVLHKKKLISKNKRNGKQKMEAGAVGAERGQGGGNWRHPQLQGNEDGRRGDGRSQKDVVASVAEIVALRQHGPGRSQSEVILGDKMPNAVPRGGLESPPENELVDSVCFAGAVVEESCAKEMKSEESKRKSGGGCSRRMRVKESNKPGVVNEKEEEDPVDNLEDQDPKKKKYGTVRIIEEEEQVDKLAGGHNMPLEAVTLPGGKESVASVGKYWGVNGSGNSCGVISGPRKNRLSYRERVVVREDIEIREDFPGDKESLSKEVEPANKSSGTEGNLGYKQKTDMSSKEMVFCSNEGEVTRKLCDFSIGSSGRRGGRNQACPPRADNSHSWRRGNSKREHGVLTSHMERDMVWVKKGDALGGNNAADVTRAH